MDNNRGTKNRIRNLQPIPKVQPPEVVTISSARLAEGAYAAAELAAFRNNLRAAITKQALDNTAALTSFADYCCQIAPGGRELYAAILKAYAYKGIVEIIGGDF